MSAAVLRQTIDGANPGGWLPDQKVTVEQSMHAYTGGRRTPAPLTAASRAAAFSLLCR